MPGADRAMSSCLPRAPKGLRLLSLLAATACLMSGPVVAQPDWPDRTVLPIAPPAYSGTAAKTLDGSRPAWSPDLSAPAGAPNILLVLVDDAGFGNPSTFGGPVATPTLDALAKDGLRYNAFHVTALCSPTRAALLTGRNQHSVGFGSIAELAGGWPGYDARWPKSAASVARVLQGNGYSTAAFGKWHLTPPADFGPAGPFDRWPSGEGFDYFWGFLGAETDQYQPLLFENNRILGTPTEQGFTLNVAMADHAIAWLKDQVSTAPSKPFFIYYATGASHAPHQVPPEWSDKYKGHFDAGWDQLRLDTFERQKRLGVVPPDTQLTPRNPAFPAWDSLSPDCAPSMRDRWRSMPAIRRRPIMRSAVSSRRSTISADATTRSSSIFSATMAPAWRGPRAAPSTKWWC